MNTISTVLSPPVASGSAAAYLQDILRWHFSPETGAPFWLDIAASLDFDPLTDVADYPDLARFPDIGHHLRNRSVDDLTPRGLSETPEVFETGGTTGSPKRLIYSREWVDRCLSWKVAEMRASGFPSGQPWLVAMPSGPHAYGTTARLQARSLRSVLHTVDLDPRWVKKEVATGGRPSQYLAHLADQIRHIVTTQNVGAVTTTPPILSHLCLDAEVMEHLQGVSYIALAGAHLDADTYDELAEAFPNARIHNVYGSTMILTTARIRNPSDPAPSAIYDGYAPYVHFGVVDPQTHHPVEYGERGQVRMAHLSAAAFIPNNLERDSAVRIPGLPDGIGDALTDLAPLAAFDGEPVIEGVY